MKNAKILLGAVVLSGLAAALPTYYYMPAHEGGACTVRTMLYYNVVTDTTIPGKRVQLAKEPRECGVYVVVRSSGE